ncbi:MAG: hypothetical protein Q7S57_06260 [bacterium]|nr:hypothetical protein [bacterium]
MKIEIASIVIGLILGLAYGCLYWSKVRRAGRSLVWHDWLPFVSGSIMAYGLAYFTLSIIF